MARKLWLILPVAASAGPWAANDLPSPDQRPCGQGFRICDPDGYMTSGIHDVEKAINALERDYQYPGCGGYEIGVVVVSGIKGGGDQSSTAIFAKSVMDMWGVGKRACSNGIVLAMAVQDRQMHIATGRGTKEFVPDAELEHVIDRMKPLMRDGQYAGAAEQCVSDIARILSGESVAPSEWPQWVQWVLGVLATLCLCGCLCGCVVGCASEDRRYEECRQKLTAIEQQRTQARARQYQQTSCAICLEEFSDTPRLENEVLVCGHTFHRQCIASWKDRSGSCPICRQSTTASAQRQAALPLVRPPVAESVYEDEYRFRLRRARYYYPSYVSNDMVDRWSSPGFAGTIVADTAFIRSSPSYREPGSSSHRSGASYGGGGAAFGGGCSAGGGGAGGGW